MAKITAEKKWEMRVEASRELSLSRQADAILKNAPSRKRRKKKRRGKYKATKLVSPPPLPKKREDPKAIPEWLKHLPPDNARFIEPRDEDDVFWDGVLAGASK